MGKRPDELGDPHKTSSKGHSHEASTFLAEIAWGLQYTRASRVCNGLFYRLVHGSARMSVRSIETFSSISLGSLSVRDRRNIRMAKLAVEWYSARTLGLLARALWSGVDLGT